MDFNTFFLEFDKVEYLQEHVMKKAYQIADSITFSTSITEGILKLFKHKLHQSCTTMQIQISMKNKNKEGKLCWFFITRAVRPMQG